MEMGRTWSRTKHNRWTKRYRVATMEREEIKGATIRLSLLLFCEMRFVCVVLVVPAAAVAAVIVVVVMVVVVVVVVVMVVVVAVVVVVVVVVLFLL